MCYKIKSVSIIFWFVSDSKRDVDPFAYPGFVATEIIVEKKENYILKPKKLNEEISDFAI